MSTSPSSTRWTIESDGAISWDVRQEKAIPHFDRVEMSGNRVSTVIHYGADEKGHLFLERDLIWPHLRLVPNDTYGSLGRLLDRTYGPRFVISDGIPAQEILWRVEFDGLLRLTTHVSPGLEIVRTIFPSQTEAALVENYIATNRSDRALAFALLPFKYHEETSPELGAFGSYRVEANLNQAGPFSLEVGAEAKFSLFWTAVRAQDSPLRLEGAAEESKRLHFLQTIGDCLQLETPEPTLNRMFSFAKIRASESIFVTRGGPLHSPGGGLKDRNDVLRGKHVAQGRYYAAIWANDQAEYACPLFPYLGYGLGNDAALNSYRQFGRYMNTKNIPLPSSIIAEGFDHWSDAGDRGDCAMIAYGAARFALARGDAAIAGELWTLVEWCLEYCRGKLNEAGVIASDSDELEGRVPAGNANLHTSVLTYDALTSASYLAQALGKGDSVVADYAERARRLGDAIGAYFGGMVEGFNTYRYYQENTDLRAWICSPLMAGIFDLKSGTVDALLSTKLWTQNGVLTVSTRRDCWDRSTLYALRGIFYANEPDRALTALRIFSQNRLLGDHVPYAVESDSEGNQSHNSPESALYVRLFTEGLFGLRPTGLRSFSFKPSLPTLWSKMELRKIRAHGETFDLHVERIDTRLHLKVIRSKDDPILAAISAGETLEVTF